MSPFVKTARRQLFPSRTATAFVPGHVIGTAALLFGTIAITKAFIARGKAQSRAKLEEALKEKERLAQKGERGQYVAQNERGQYGRSTP